jgi:16S rRNA (cytidine1402-2'-O)-methyltransferase
LDTQEKDKKPFLKNSGTLYLAAVPIGNDADFSIRCIDILKSVDLILCEEYKEAKRILKLLSIEKDLLALNEHTENDETRNVIDLLKQGKNIALISDHGTPLIEDPGKHVVREVIKNNLKVTSVPGPSSILTALILSGFDTKKFTYCGLLSPKKDERAKELKAYKSVSHTTIFLDTPYRLNNLLESMLSIIGADREIALCINLTTADEKVFRGKIKNVISQIKESEIKKPEFVIVMKGSEKIDLKKKR